MIRRAGLAWRRGDVDLWLGSVFYQVEGALSRLWRQVLLVGPLVVLLVFESAPISHAGGDTVWAPHQAYSLGTDLDLDLNEFPVALRSAVDTHGFNLHFTERSGSLHYNYPFGASLVYAPIVLAFEAVSGSSLYDKLNAVWPGDYTQHLGEFENSVQSFVCAAVAALMMVWLRRRTSALATVFLTGVFAFSTSMLSSVSRAMWNVGPSLLGTMLVLIGLDEFLRPSSRNRKLAAVVVLGVVPVWLYVTRPTAALVGLVVLWVLMRHDRRYLLLLGPIGLASLGFVRLVIDKVWGPEGHPYYGRQTTVDFKLEALVANFVSPARGLLIWSPVLILALAGPVLGRRSDERLVSNLAPIAMTWIVAHAVAISTFEDLWWGGVSVGPRLMADVLPAFILLLIPVLERLSVKGIPQTLGTAAFFSLVLFGIFVHLHAARDPSVLLWNLEEPEQHIWNWRDPQFLQGIG